MATASVPEGTMRRAPNGYWYIKTPQGQRLIHHVIAEKFLGRPLLPGERVLFKDGNKNDYDIANLEVVPPKRSTLFKLQMKVRKMQEQLADISVQLERALSDMPRDFTESNDVSSEEQ